MILLSNIAKRVLNEILSFKELMNFSEPKRKKRALKMRTQSLPIRADSTNEYWNFSYKSDLSHITPRPEKPNGIGHKGRITFKKENSSASSIDIPCKVDCTCEDYRYKYAYANNDKEAGEMGNNSLNKCNGNFPKTTNPYLRPGLCKHLLSLREYLRTKLQESDKTTLAEKLDDIVTNYPIGILQMNEQVEELEESVNDELEYLTSIGMEPIDKIVAGDYTMILIKNEDGSHEIALTSGEQSFTTHQSQIKRSPVIGRKNQIEIYKKLIHKLGEWVNRYAPLDIGTMNQVRSSRYWKLLKRSGFEISDIEHVKNEEGPFSEYWKFTIHGNPKIR